MDERRESEAAPTKNHTTVERRSERELVVTRTVNGPARLVFVGGGYRLVFPHQDSTMEFFGTYLEVTPHSRLVWTNEEGDGGVTVTTVTFDEIDGRTLVAVHDLYPSKEAADAAAGSTGAMPEALDQLDELLVSLGSTTTK